MDGYVTPSNAQHPSPRTYLEEQTSGHGIRIAVIESKLETIQIDVGVLKEDVKQIGSDVTAIKASNNVLFYVAIPVWAGVAGAVVKYIFFS